VSWPDWCAARLKRSSSALTGQYIPFIVQISGDDGASAADWGMTGPMTAELRADRSGKGNGRVNTVSMQCTDPSTALSAMRTVSVTVPHDQGK